jgi:protein-disulfide isomerase
MTTNSCHGRIIIGFAHMSSEKNKNTKFLVLSMILAIIAGLSYFKMTAQAPVVAPESVVATAPTPVETPQVLPMDDKSAAKQAETPKVGAPVPSETNAVVANKIILVPSGETSKDTAVEDMMAQRSLGSDTAPIKVLEYSSLTCGHCAAFHKNDFPKIKTEYIDTGKVQFIFKEFPLNKPAVDASKLLRCMPKERFASFMSLLFEEQEKWAYQPDYLPGLKQNAKLAGLSDEQVDACLTNKTLEDRIIGDMKAGSDAYKIQATPTFIVNGGEKTIVGHQPVESFEAVFNALLNGTALPEDAK